MKQATQHTHQIGLQHSAATLTITKVVKLMLFTQPTSDAHVTTMLLLCFQAATLSTALIGFRVPRYCMHQYYWRSVMLKAFIIFGMVGEAGLGITLSSNL